MPKPDLTRSGFRGPRSSNDLARAKAKLQAFRQFPKVITGGTGSVVSGGASAATYLLTGPGTISENGSNNAYTVNTTNFTGTLYWSINSTSSNFTLTSGTVTITSDTGTFDLAAIADASTEGNQSYTITLRTDSQSGPVVRTLAITVSDTSTGTPAATYSVSGASSSVNEGSPLTINVTTSNVSNGTTLYYTIGTNAGDFSTTNGSFTINSDAGSFTVTPTADSATEGAETFTVQIRTGSTGGSVVATTSPAIQINDTSTGAAAASYTVSPAANNINEGSALTINVSTANVSDGTTLYWTILGNTGDFGTTSGDFNITSNAGAFTVTPTADSTTESTAETFQVQIRTTNTGGTVEVTTDAITINDTSQTPAFSPDYTLSVSYGGTGIYTLAGSDRIGSISGNNPALAFNAGDKVRFSNSVNGAHPLYVKTVQGTGTGNQASGVSGAGTATVDWTIPAGSGTYYYQCSVHNAMYGTITVT